EDPVDYPADGGDDGDDEEESSEDDEDDEMDIEADEEEEEHPAPTDSIPFPPLPSILSPPSPILSQAPPPSPIRSLEREVGYGITDSWDEIMETLQGTPVSTDTELGGYMREFKKRVRHDTDEIYMRLDDEQTERHLLAVQG
nr:hypothetical protein [Tanacetum cinerariifolium]